jgi:hypothetical protein
MIVYQYLEILIFIEKKNFFKFGSFNLYFNNYNKRVLTKINCVGKLLVHFDQVIENFRSNSLSLDELLSNTR